jgi:hypothetical protein
MGSLRLEFPLNHNKTEAYGLRFQNLATPPSSPAVGQIYFDTDTSTPFFWDGADWVEITAGTGFTEDEIKDFVGEMVAGNTETGIAVTYESGDKTLDFVAEVTQAELDAVDDKIDNHIADTTDAHDASAISFTPASGIAATDVQAAIVEALTDAQAYADAIAQGLKIHASVKAVATSALDLSGAETIDGHSTSNGDRILATAQADADENGIWVVAAGSWTRPADFDAAGDVVVGAYVLVEEGTIYEGTGWTLSELAGSFGSLSEQTWTQFSGAGEITAGSALTKTGNTLDVAVDNSTIEVSGDALRVKDGGITDAKLASTFTKKYSATVGDNSSTSINVDHNLGTRDVQVEVYDASTYETVLCDVTRSTTNRVVLGFAVAPSTNALRVVVTG